MFRNWENGEIFSRTLNSTYIGFMYWDLFKRHLKGIAINSQDSPRVHKVILVHLKF